MPVVTARAHTNIALVKYWGKRASEENLPATGSLSLTLDRFFTTTTLLPTGEPRDSLALDGAPAGGEERARVERFLDRLRAQAKSGQRFAVSSTNSVPTAAGLASSASAFAALALAGARALGLTLDPRALSLLARRGSGSAARSVFGGFALMHRGTRDDGEDSFAEPLATSLDVKLVVARCGEGRKKLGSTEAMERTRQTSPFYAPWLETHPADLDEAAAAVRGADLEKLGEVMERSTLKMHATCLGARPPFWYLAPPTVAAMNTVVELRARGTPCWFTMDAGPHVKALCATRDADVVARALAETSGVSGVDVAGAGPAAHILDER